jgi:hypothetical protein
MRSKIFYSFLISDYSAGNIYVRRSLPSSWTVGSPYSNKNEEVSIDLDEGCFREAYKSFLKNKFMLYEKKVKLLPVTSHGGP